MKQLEKEIRTNGFLYCQVYRNHNFAIYSQWSGNVIIAYELIKIRKRKDRILFGKHYPAPEVYPDTKSWGNEGWSFKNLNQAMKRLSEYSNNLQNLEQRANAGDIILQDIDGNQGLRKKTA